jgi:hypothetical protein
MKRILLLIILAGLAGCVSTEHVKKAPRAGAGPKNEYVEEMQGSRVYAAIKSRLERGATVNVMVEYQNSFDGLPAGYQPADFACNIDAETVVETEKIFLLDSFSKYPCFNVVDRSRMDASLTESKLGMSGITASNIQPGAMSGASHLIVIEGKNHFFHINGQNKERYTEIKKLLDIQKNVVVAMDKLSEERDVKLVGPRHPQANPAAEQAYEPPQENAPLQQLPPIIEATPAPSPVETIRISGDHVPSQAEVISYSPQPVQAQNNETITVISQSGPARYQPANARQKYVHAKKIPDWQIARIVKQRYPALKKEDDKAAVQQFIKKHPEYRERIISSESIAHHLKVDNR